jgi:Cdc6-like AAA superfamily ATPase
MKLSDIVPGESDRALIVGQTGSGKTVLSQFLCSYRDQVVVCDPKRRVDWPGYQIHKTLKTLTQSKHAKLVYRPNHDALKNWDGGDDEIERFFEWVYRRRNTTLYVDETYLVTKGEEMPRFYHACLTQGRELGIETWSATQRPMNVPQVVMSEAEHVYAFFLRMPQDRRKVEMMCGIDGDALGELPKYYFYYAPQDGEAMGPLKLDLKTYLKRTVTNG